jgi:putative YphP/YqiW family bacilliredoxin
MWEELAKCGVDPVKTAEEVDEALKAPGTTLVIVNSVCGCAAGSARPGVTRALQNATIPDHLKTVFAGVDRDATERAREYMKGIPPSSPAVALFKDGELVHMLERRHIERMDEEMVAQNLAEAFDAHCARKGPSVPKDVYESVVSLRQCGSSVPLFNPFVNR